MTPARLARLASLAGTVAGMLIALTLAAVIGVLQTIDDTDAEKLREQVAQRDRAVEWADLDEAARRMTAFDRIGKK